MLAIAALLLLGYIAQQSLMNVYVIYADFRYHWTDRTVGLSLATIGITTAIYGAFLVKPVVAELGERGAITLGLIGGAIGYSMFGLSKTGLIFWLGIPFLNMMSFTWPAAKASSRKRPAPPNKVNSRARSTLHSPGTPFYTAAGMLLIALVIAQQATRHPQPTT